MPRSVPALFLVLAVVAAACSSSRDEARPRPCVTPTPYRGAADLPDLPMRRWVTLTRVRQEADFLTVDGVTTTRIVELYPQIARALLARRYTILSGDNEGFEAEIFFKRGRAVTGTILLREGPCGDLVTFSLLYGGVRA